MRLSAAVVVAVLASTLPGCGGGGLDLGGFSIPTGWGPGGEWLPDGLDFDPEPTTVRVGETVELRLRLTRYPYERLAWTVDTLLSAGQGAVAIEAAGCFPIASCSAGVIRRPEDSDHEFEVKVEATDTAVLHVRGVRPGYVGMSALAFVAGCIKVHGCGAYATAFGSIRVVAGR
jgi:hypothetical protein